MINLTDQILEATGRRFQTVDYCRCVDRCRCGQVTAASILDDSFYVGAQQENNVRGYLDEARQAWATIRARHGFVERHADLLTEPSANLKLDKGEMPAYGLTLQHYVTSFARTSGKNLVVNACPNAGDCTKVCVLDNGNGRYDRVQRARKAKTEFLATQPHLFVFLLGYELARAVRKHGKILLRPNVNSDVQWERVLPSLTEGKVFGSLVQSYGYTKLESVLDTDGWLGQEYRVAFSASEKLGLENQRLWAFLKRGGSVAVVTDRKPKSDVHQWLNIPTIFARIVDADVSDEWVFQSGVIGDLSAKGSARRLIGKSGFVLGVYS
jgi:hypothetical protein